MRQTKSAEGLPESMRLVDDRRINGTLADIVFRQNATGVLAVPLIISAVLYVLWHEVPLETLVSWAVAYLLVSGVPLLLVHAFRGASPADQGAAKWRRFHLVAAICQALPTALLAATCFHHVGPEHQAFLVMTCNGVAAGALVLFTGFLASSIWFGITMLGPLAVTMLSSGQEMAIVLGVLVLAYLGFLINASNEFHVALKRSIAYRISSEDLAMQLRDALENANDAVKAKERFLATMTHEMRSPMNSIIGMNELLANTDLDPTQKSYCVNMKDASHDLLGVINDILDFSRLSAGLMQLERIDFSVDDIVNRVLRMFEPLAQEKKVRLSAEVAPDVPAIVNGDPTRIRQVLNNLVGNAIKFTDVGEVELRISYGALHGKQPALFCEVRDTGEGIAPDVQESLFQAFTQADASISRRHGGSGLGLAICQEIIKLMDGEMDLTSALGQGSTFRARLPVSLPADATAAATEDSKALVMAE